MSEASLPQIAPRARASARAESAAPLRDALVLGAFLLTWVSLHPFQGLGTDAAIELTSGNDTPVYAVYGFLAVAALGLGRARLARVWRHLASVPLVGMSVWAAVTSLVSDDPATSFRRLALTACVVALAAALFLLADSQTRLAKLLAVGTLAVLGLCYAGVIFAPDLAIHQATDLGEPELAGDWRGVFAHKNEAGAVVSLFAFFGLFAARSGMPLTGPAIIVLSVVFLVFSGGKSALALVGVTLLTTAFWTWRGRGWLRVLVVLSPVAVLNLFGLGSVLFEQMASLTRALPVDTTFTGRTGIWAFALDSLSGHWLFGHGFQAFWNSASTRFGTEDAGWAGTAAHAHNGYLDLVVTMGLPGLVLGVVLFVVQPLRDAERAARRGTDPATLAMLIQVWLFGLYLSGMETFFFIRVEPIWVTFLFALFGLRLAAASRLRKCDP